MDLDILGLAETHLVGESVLDIDGYRWYGHNRTKLHVRARAGSGGVGFLVKNELHEGYDIGVLDNEYEGILWLKLRNKLDNSAICACVCYVPPEHSTRNVCMSDFLDNLLVQIHSYQNDGLLFVCGDVNSRQCWCRHCVGEGGH